MAYAPGIADGKCGLDHFIAGICEDRGRSTCIPIPTMRLP
jgi:hypothetical protein